MSRIYFDTMLFVYWLEKHPEHGRRVSEIRKRMEERQDTLCTSVFTLGEVLVGVYKDGALDKIPDLRRFFGPPDMELIPFTADTADRYAQIRAKCRVSPPDAIHLAAAAHASVDLFLTNDHRLRGLTIPGIHFIAGLDVNLF